MHVVLSHGRGLNAQSKDMVYLARTAEALGHSTHRVDDRDCQNPVERKERLSAYLADCPEENLILAGFSMGAYASLWAAAEHRERIRALLLIAPALYIPHYPQETYPILPNTYLIHGWQDELVPYQYSLRYAEYANASLQLLAAGHLFKSPAELKALCFYFQTILKNHAENEIHPA